MGEAKSSGKAGDEALFANDREQERPSVLFVCADPLLPLYGGGPVRIFALVEHFHREGFRVDAVARDHGRRLNRQIRERFDRVWFLHSDEGSVWGPSRWTKIRRRLTSRIPWPMKSPLRRWLPERFRASATHPPRDTSYILRKIDPALCQLGGRAAREGGHDAVISEFAWTARALDEVPEDVLRILDTHDIQHLRDPVAQAAGRALPHHRCTREEEVEELERADLLLAIQNEEAEILRELCPAREIIVAEHALDHTEILASPVLSRTVLFVGNLYDPNVSGLSSFIERSWPQIRESSPGCELIVCGRVCEAFESEVEGVRFLGVVPELESHYSNAAVVINPAAYGSGLNIKTVEALSLGKCVVGTPAAFRGIRVDEEMGCQIVETGADMAGPVLSLMSDAEERARLEKRAHAFAAKYFSPDVVYSELVGAIRRHSGNRHRRLPKRLSGDVASSTHR